MSFFVPQFRFSKGQDHDKPFETFSLYKILCPLLTEAQFYI